MGETTLDHAMQHVAKEIGQNGPEEGNRIWDDENHPLKQAFVILFRAQIETGCFDKEAAALMEQHRRAEETP